MLPTLSRTGKNSAVVRVKNGKFFFRFFIIRQTFVKACSAVWRVFCRRPVRCLIACVIINAASAAAGGWEMTLAANQALTKPRTNLTTIDGQLSNACVRSWFTANNLIAIIVRITSDCVIVAQTFELLFSRKINWRSIESPGGSGHFLHLLANRYDCGSLIHSGQCLSVAVNFHLSDQASFPYGWNRWIFYWRKKHIKIGFNKMPSKKCVKSRNRIAPTQIYTIIPWYECLTSFIERNANFYVLQFIY